VKVSFGISKIMGVQEEKRRGAGRRSLKLKKRKKKSGMSL